MKQDSSNITAKAIIVAVQFISGAISMPWWIITYFMISGTLQEEHTAPLCVPIGIGMLAISILLTFFLIKFSKKVFEKKWHTFLFTFSPFLLGIIIFMLCAIFAI